MAEVELTYVEAKINHYGNMIVKERDVVDDWALGELNFYVTLRRVLKHEGTKQDLGMMDAINDTLISQGLVKKGEKFYKQTAPVA
ncbi:MAG: hypothetical protein AAB316_03465 [Bacteroidota bacterium]